MRRFLKQLGIAFGFLGLVGAGVVAWRVWPRTTVVLTDADSIRVPTEGAAVRDVLWRPAEQVGGSINTGGDDYEAEISDDGMTMYFVRGRPGDNAEIFSTHRTRDGWSEPQPVVALNSPFDDLGPELSPDGRTIFFYSNREGGLGGFDLWLARRGDERWHEPVNLGAAVNTMFDDYGPAMTPDGRAIYFASNRPREEEEPASDTDAWQATLRENRRMRDFDLYHAEVTEGGPRSAVPLAVLNTTHDEGAPTLSPFGDFLYFASNRPGGAGGFDLYRSRRAIGTHHAPESLGNTINSPANELDPEVSLGGYGLHFSSDRSAMLVPSGTPSVGAADESAATERSNYDIYYSASREVFREVETQRASIDWAALWRAIGPNLLWAILALLLLALFAALMRDFRDRRLSLLARCLVASLMAHMVLMLLFNVWQVGSAVARAFDRGEKVRVSLISSAVGEQIFSQVRGEFTEVATPAPAVTVAQRMEAFEPSPTVDPGEAVRFTTIESAPIYRAAERIVEVAQSDDSKPAARSETDFPTLREPIPVATAAVSVADVSLPTEAAQTSATETAAESPDVVLMNSAIRSELSTATSQPAMTRVEVNPDAMPPIPATFTVTHGTTTPVAADADVPANPPSRPALTEFDANVIQTVTKLDSRDLALPASSMPGTDTDSEPSLTLPNAIASTTPSRPESPTPDSTGLATSSVQVDSPTSSAPIATSEASKAGDPTALDAPAKGVELASTVQAPDPVSAPSTGTLDLALTLPGRDEPAMAQVAAESSPVVAPMPVPGVRAGAERPVCESSGIASSEPVRIDPGTTPRVATEPMSASFTQAPDAIIAARDEDRPNTGSISIVSGDAPTLDLALPADRAGVLPPDAVGVIRGRVTDEATHEPVPSAAVRLVLPDDRTIEAPTDSDGAYSLYVPPTPDFFALSASREGYLPRTTNVGAANLSANPLTVDFELQRQSSPVIALEEKPDVHHLGNDLFEGRINSRFQREAEGRTFLATFQIDTAQIAADYSRAEIHFFARGVQCSHPLRVNGRLLRERLDASPDDGSFGEFVAEFNPAWLIEGENTFKIRAQSCRGDLDDFEFVNIQIKLIP